MKVLVIIPILNPDARFFKVTIPMLKSQSIKHEILLINSGEDIPRGDYKNRKIEKKEFNHANTRNIALEYNADFYLFMTQDALPYDERLIENLLIPFENNDVAISYARQIPHKNAHITEKFAREKNYPDISICKAKKDIQKLGIKTFFSSNSCAMYKGVYFRNIGGFKKDLQMSEDMEFAARAIFGDKIICYSSKAKVFHSHNYNTYLLFKRYMKIGKFFRENRWIEDNIKDKISIEKTGKNQVIEEMKYIMKSEPLAIFKSIYFTLVKYVGYKVGKTDNRQ
jgi:rhamnosyltransferase